MRKLNMIRNVATLRDPYIGFRFSLLMLWLILALLFGAWLSGAARAQTTVLDQAPIPLSGTSGQSEILLQSVPVAGGTVDVTVVRSSGVSGVIQGVSQSFRASGGLATYTVNPVTAATPTTAAGYQNYVGNFQTQVLIEPTATMPFSYTYLPTAPYDGQAVCEFTTATITLLYWTTIQAGQSINNATTTLAANARNCFTYSASNAVWNRSM